MSSSEQIKNRVVVDTPTSRREVVRTETATVPRREGISGAAVAAIVVGAVALVTIAFLLLMGNQQAAENANLQATNPPPAQQPIIVQQPAPQSQTPIIVQAPPSTQPAPVVINPPATGSASSTGNDLAIQSAIDKKISEDATLTSLGIVASVIEGKVTLIGTVRSQEAKAQAERIARSIRGVTGVDNQLVIS